MLCCFRAFYCFPGTSPHCTAPITTNTPCVMTASRLARVQEFRDGRELLPTARMVTVNLRAEVIWRQLPNKPSQCQQLCGRIFSSSQNSAIRAAKHRFINTVWWRLRGRWASFNWPLTIKDLFNWINMTRTCCLRLMLRSCLPLFSDMFFIIVLFWNKDPLIMFQFYFETESRNNIFFLELKIRPPAISHPWSD